MLPLKHNFTKNNFKKERENVKNQRLKANEKSEKNEKKRNGRKNDEKQKNKVSSVCILIPD